ncbi:alkaline phosphatase family protein [candidate division WOR-3 bacterium]|nr:alkaline phosphatase family protein [candidate division WOR-3 bacterium]
MKRIKVFFMFTFLLLLLNCWGQPDKMRTFNNKEPTSVVVLGMDGLDPGLLRDYIKKGKLPNFEKLAYIGDFKKLGTSYPPQSPVAWSNFITGNNPGEHGIYDFIHREPLTYTPYLSTSEKKESKWKIQLGRWSIPLVSSKIELKRKSKAFWSYLEERKIPAFIIKIPSNFPPEGRKTRCISGLGTPDIKGTNGEFSFYSDEDNWITHNIDGGNIYSVSVVDEVVSSYLYGPENPWMSNKERLKIKFQVYLSKENKTALIRIDDKDIFLEEGEWSEWIPVRFRILPPFFSLSTICRFYLKEVTPHLKLYVSPLNIDPKKPAMPISTPFFYSREVYKKTGYFYTQGMPEESKALTEGLFNRDDYIKQMELVWEERKKLFKLVWEEFDRGVFFIYFTTPDVNQHLFWSTMDSRHPAYSEDINKKYGKIIEKTYIRMDSILGAVLNEISDSTLLLVLSDHGFGPFHRAFNVNTWLYENGYLSLIDERQLGRTEMLKNIDWKRTRAYSLGFNAIYINLRGREGEGIVDKEDKEKLIKEIVERLERVVDPKTGEYPIYRAYIGKNVYKGKYKDIAPDICIGYRRGYRTSWESAIGAPTENIFSDNTGVWSGTHLISPELIPGILLSNRKIKLEDPDLRDLPATILREFDIPEDMEGRDLFKRDKEENCSENTM